MKDDFFRKRIMDLAAQSDRSCRFTFTDFLTEAEYAEFCAVSSQLPPCGYSVSGGRADAGRVMIRFGSEENLGFAEDFPISCLHIAPLQEKFAEKLAHRDILGAVMHLGIERGEIGDILTEEKNAYLFCKTAMADYLCRELTRIRHTSVCCQVTDALPDAVSTHCEPGTVQAASARIDGVISKIYHISRGDCAALFRAGRVFVDGAVTENNSRVLKEGEKVSVRGYGKFRYLGISGTTRKGKTIVTFEKYV